jgi:hypothetical protein
MEREVSEAARDNLLMVRLIDLDKRLDLLHGKIGAPADALTVSAFRAAMVEVHESDSAFKEALCAQVHDTIDPFSNYTSALNRIFGELEQIRILTAPKIAPAASPKRSSDGRFKGKKKNA